MSPPRRCRQESIERTQGTQHFAAEHEPGGQDVAAVLSGIVAAAQGVE
jgi:hypothetical protein